MESLSLTSLDFLIIFFDLLSKTYPFFKLLLMELELSNLDKSRKFIEEDFKPLNDMRASSEYRKLVSKNLIKYLKV